MRIDLHTHSLHSDGSDRPADLVEKAAAAGLDVVALTDHDTVVGWSEATEAGKRHRIIVVLGAEFSVTDNGRGRHLLGYNFKAEHPAIAEILAKAATSRADRAEKLFAKVKERGLQIDREYVTSLAGGIPSRKHLAAGLVRADNGIPDEDAAFAEYLNEGGSVYVQRYRPTIEETIRAIKAAGGVSVIAHPRDDKRGEGVSDERLRQLATVGLDGIEVDHQAHPPEVRAALRRTAAKLGLVATGSSDYHGDRKVNHDLGCNLTDVDVARRLLGSSFDGS